MDINFGQAILWVLLFILAATLHEGAHAWMAKRGGDPTAYEGGQVSLNPWPHIRRQPLGMVIIPFVSALLLGWPFGFASTPYDPVWAHNHPRKVALMALAGPVTHLLMLLLCVLLVKVGISTGFFAQPDMVNFTHIVDPGNNPVSERFGMTLSMFYSLNLIMLVLNLIPLPPLDGSSVISFFMKEETARKYNRIISNPGFGIFGLLLAWQVFSPLIDFIFPFVINLMYWGSHYA